ncbi:uncharacterized protein LOC123515212 isoform X2 [Portunus trituberculatus]|uniref:uncharacterized protein LOC123515212 isoform X2 n=1 Tax=Portunus trituberculatus TaxID=210409 RepID=UPI001E1CE795|nr:uncharacterized protein LOC123515212 isoform X2 [Portunus trituberculatus]XP_045129696.1 uncharacterized protein LOC123515212 isoform X2 [Portunus trituberculatus]
MDSTWKRESSDHSNLIKQLKAFYFRVQVGMQTSGISDALTSLSSHLNLLQKTTDPDTLPVQLLKFSQSLQSNTKLAEFFLVQFMNYIESTIDLEGNLDNIKETIRYLLPCINVALKNQSKEQIQSNLLKDDFFPNLYRSMVDTFRKESMYQEASITDILNYQNTKDRIVKAHIVRMNQEDSKRTFQEAFGDCGNIASLYLIYVWQIYMIYEIRKENFILSSIHSLTQAMEKSGKYIVVVPYKDLKKMALTDPFSPAGRYHNILTQTDKVAARHPIPDLDFEWTDFQISVLHPNGVAFLTNSAAWKDSLRKISSTIESLEVKRCLRFSPALGSTFALPLKCGTNTHQEVEGVSFIRVRVVRVTQTTCGLYGIDNGSFHQCKARDLVLLPASIINLPPCGRLARLPVVPSPASSSVAPALCLVAALAQHTALVPNLSQADIQQASLWLQVAELNLPTLHFLKALTCQPASQHLLPIVASVVVDHLLRLTDGNQPSQKVIVLLVSILTLIMKKSSKISLILARRGLFTALCEAALTWGCQEVWQCIKVLCGRKQLIREFLSHNTRAAHLEGPLRNPKPHQPWKARSPDLHDTSPTVVQMANLTTPDYNWDLKMRATFPSPQLVQNPCPGKWCWDKDEVLSSHTSVLERGRHLGVKTDLTCHILQERNVSSICSDTLLQIILGMLNTHLGGKIYIGLNQFGVVEGIKMTRVQQDCFLLGFCKIVTSDIYPSLLPCDSVAHFVPVQQPDAASPQSEFPYYVIILTIQPEPKQVYFPKDHSEKVYMRDGGVTLTLHGSRRAELLSKTHVWAEELEQQVREEKQALLQLALDRSHQH